MKDARLHLACAKSLVLAQLLPKVFELAAHSVNHCYVHARVHIMPRTIMFGAADRRANGSNTTV